MRVLFRTHGFSAPASSPGLEARLAGKRDRRATDERVKPLRECRAGMQEGCVMSGPATVLAER